MLPGDGGAQDGGECEVGLLWRSRHGCPLCAETSYAALSTDCVGGYRDVSYTRRSPPEYS
jgi:hypothetical protein